ncbi:phage tail-collar fiber domain-containing protein [Marinomonas transparens]|uniref:Phage tail protein n=1 Tax=Marinomonas transparens TaxID=2795388 RepID=A0A934JTD0_9GAMM|nr:phage tail protein [Marinomonas transparens]MBJ7536944.1 phage tail protein [Marinomonas transparens]
MAFITIAGQNQIAKKQGDNTALNIATFVLANVPNLGSEPATRIESIPNSDVVDQLSVTKSGYVNTNQVVYSLVMGSNVGDYQFNWVGLVDDEGVLIAVTYIPLTTKKKNDGAVPGNTFTRNFLISYTGIQQTTSITVPAETWQIDFTARLSGIDERERLANLDVYGHEGFLGDGWKVTGSAGTYSVAAGIGYVGGIRAKNTAPQEITTSTFPNEIWLNVSLQGDISDMTAVAEFVIDTGPFTDYVDGNGISHYLTKLANIDAAGEVVEARTTSEIEKTNHSIFQIKTQLSNSFSKGIVSEPAFQLDAGTLKTVADLGVAIDGNFYSYDEGTGLVLPESMSLGTDYAIYATPDGLVVSANFTVPDGYTALTSRRVGGFHYQDGVINEYSIYDVKYKPGVRDPRGMVRSPLGIWGDIYLLNTSPDINGTSAYNVTIADGSSPPKVPVIWGGDGTAQYDDFSQYTAARMLAAYGKRLPSSHEFEQLAFGSVAGYAVGTDPVTTKFDASAKSMIGCEQVSGHMWQWGSERWDRGNGSSGYAWYGADTNGEGQVYTADSSGVGASLFGGYWVESGNAGSRASSWTNEPWYSYHYIAARGVCDHFES